MKVLFERLDIGRMDGYPQICASAEAEARKYFMVVGSSGRRFFIADQEEMAQNVYVEGNIGSDGFGGRWLTFPLVDGRVVETKGPWQTNSDHLFNETGVDVRDTYPTIVIVGKDQGSDGPPTWNQYLTDIVHFEEKPVLGRFNRDKEIATRIATELGHPVQCYQRSYGGSSRGTVYPEGWTQEQIKEYWKQKNA